MDKVLYPTNRRAVGAPAAGAGGGGGGFSDSEAEVKASMARLTAALKSANPPPVVVQEPDQEPIRIEVTIQEFGAAAAATPAGAPGGAAA